MIYAVSPDLYPTQEQCIEEIKYKDENDFEWRIARINSGFFVRYFGNPYFQETFFSFHTSDEKHYLVNNTGCILFKDPDFETFAEVREIIKNGFTDEIWECFEDLFTERFEHDTSVLESEIPTNR